MRFLRRALSVPALAEFPVRVRSGVAEGAKWSLYPYSAYWRGTHEPEFQRRISTLWDWTGKHVWDLGAHYGLFSVGLARRVGPTGRVAAFEPNPVSYARLQLHLRRNHLRNLHAFPFAVGETPAILPLLVYDGLESTTTHLPYENETIHAGIPRVDVPVVRLDDLVAAGAIPAPDFIKMDVEGHGHRALRGAAETLRRHRPVIACGLHGPEETEGIANLLRPLGYRPESVSGQTSEPLHPSGDYLWFPRSA